MLMEDLPFTSSEAGQERKGRRIMTNARRMIGVCLSQAHTFLKTDLLAELDKAARKEGYSIVVFNSSMDYYWAQNGNNITGYVADPLRHACRAGHSGR